MPKSDPLTCPCGACIFELTRRGSWQWCDAPAMRVDWCPECGANLWLSRDGILSFRIPGPAVPKARMTSQGRFSLRAQKTLEYQGRVRQLAFAADPKYTPPPIALVHIVVAFSDLRRRDPDNCAKTILDGLQPQAIIDDSIRYVRRTTIAALFVDRGEEYAHVVVRPITASQLLDIIRAECSEAL